MLIGRHTAEPSTSTDASRYGHVSRSALLGQIWVCPRVVAGQSIGELTGHPGASVVEAAARRKWARLESATRSSIGTFGIAVTIARSISRYDASSVRTSSSAR